MSHWYVTVAVVVLLILHFTRWLCDASFSSAKISPNNHGRRNFSWHICPKRYNQLFKKNFWECGSKTQSITLQKNTTAIAMLQILYVLQYTYLYLLVIPDIWKCLHRKKKEYECRHMDPIVYLCHVGRYHLQDINTRIDSFRGCPLLEHLVWRNCPGFLYSGYTGGPRLSGKLGTKKVPNNRNIGSFFILLSPE